MTRAENKPDKVKKSIYLDASTWPEIEKRAKEKAPSLSIYLQALALKDLGKRQ